MMANSAELAYAISAMYSESAESGLRRQADAWLQKFRSSEPGSWRLCLALLTGPGSAGGYEQYFAANTVRCACQKFADVLDPPCFSDLLAVLVTCLKSASEAGNWPVATQLSLALAALAVRAGNWEANSIIPGVISMYFCDLQLLNAPELSFSLLSLLQFLVSLVETSTSRHLCVSQSRRSNVTDAFRKNTLVIVITLAALNSPLAPCVNYGLKLIHGWCELGNPPVGLDSYDTALQTICEQIVVEERTSKAAECLTALFNCCKDGQRQQLLYKLLAVWQPIVGFVKDDVFGCSTQLRTATCNVLCAACNAMLPAALQQGSVLRTHFEVLGSHLLGYISDPCDEVALQAVEFWQDTYIVLLRKVVSGGLNPSVVTSQSLVLQQLTSSLVLRTRLHPTIAAVATADARDLPDDVRMVRRELASALRDITALVGLDTMLQYMASVVQAAAHTAQQRQPGELPDWLDLECALYAANVVLGRCSDTFDSGSIQILVDIAAGSIMLNTGSHKLAGTALTLLGGLPGWYVRHAELVPFVLHAVQFSLQADDDKLSRNAATTIHRLAQHEGLARLLVKHHIDWLDALMSLYHSHGGVQSKSGHGYDLTTEEFILVALCRIACVVPEDCGPCNLLLHLAAPKADEARRQLRALGLGPVVGQQAAELAEAVAKAVEVLAVVLESVPVPASGAAASGALVGQVTEMVSCVWDVLQGGMQLASRHGAIQPAMVASCCEFLRAAVRVLGRGPAPLLQPIVALLQPLPASVLALPCVMQLLTACMNLYPPVASADSAGAGATAAAAAAAVVGTADMAEVEVDGGAAEEAEAAAAAFRAVVTTSLTCACEQVLSVQTSPEAMIALLRLASGCTRHCAGVLGSQALIDSLSSATVVALKTYDAEQCKSVLEWVAALCSAPYGTASSGAMMAAAVAAKSAREGGAAAAVSAALAADELEELASMPSASASSAASSESTEGQAALGLLRNQLDTGLGAQLVVGLMMAAGGDMPPDHVLPVAGTLHAIWVSCGTRRFTCWLETAVFHISPPGAPWLQRFKPEMKALFVRELTGPDCQQDVARFKRVLKAFTGCKKKGGVPGKKGANNKY